MTGKDQKADRPIEDLKAADDFRNSMIKRPARDEHSIEVAQMDAAGRLTVAIKRLAERDAEIERLRGALWVAAERLEARGHNFGAADARRAASADA